MAKNRLRLLSIAHLVGICEVTTSRSGLRSDGGALMALAKVRNIGRSARSAGGTKHRSNSSDVRAGMAALM
jgi:hypothetical protein